MPTASISPSPSNPKVVAAAARMAAAFHASLTAIYVKPTHYDALSEADRARLQSNIRFAEQSGASVTTIVGDDVQPGSDYGFSLLNEKVTLSAGGEESETEDQYKDYRYCLFHS